MNKLFLIARKEISDRFADPVILLLNIAVPLVIAALISLAFGDIFLGAGIPERKALVGIANRDRGSRWGNVGEALMRVMIPDHEESALSGFGDWRLDLFDVRQIEDEPEARRMVEQEKLIAALFIPPDFSEALAAEHATIGVYIDGGESILGTAFGNVAQAIANAIATGEVTARTTVKALAHNPRLRTQLKHGLLDEPLAELVLRAALPESNPIQVRRVNHVAPPVQVKLTHFLAAAIAILFTGFTALMGSASILQEKAQWTLQRMTLTPTRPGIIQGGKALGAYLTSLIHMGALMGGMAALEWMLNGDSVTSSAINIAGLAILILAVVTAATGFGAAVAGFARTYAGAANYGRAILVLMGLIGGIFFPVDLLPPPLDMISRLTFHYWALDGYLKLARGGSTLNIVPHVLILVAMGLLFFAVGNRLLKRRLAFS